MKELGRPYSFRWSIITKNPEMGSLKNQKPLWTSVGPKVGPKRIRRKNMRSRNGNTPVLMRLLKAAFSWTGVERNGGYRGDGGVMRP